MRLTPQGPPGRAGRKARAFQLEIGQLRAAAYSFPQIRDALADAGIHVSIPTVRREAARCSPLAPPSSATSPGTSAGCQAASAPTSSSTVTEPVPDRPLSGREIAEAFMKGRINNPLLRNRIDDEGPRR